MSNRTTAHGPEEHHKLIVDSSFIAMFQPDDLDQRKAYYHSKSPTNYAFKIQIACDFSYKIVHVSECYQGSVHDITILRESRLLEHVEKSVKIIGEAYVVTLRKKYHGRELTDEDKSFNRDINSARGVIDDFYRITKIIQVVSALDNMNLNKHPIRK